MIRALLVVASLVACGGVETANVPPTGDIWFGDSFNPETFEMSGRTDTVSTTETFAFVATLPRSMESGEMNVRVSWDGQQVSNETAEISGSGDVVGFTYGPTFQAGTWGFEITDLGGNVLAEGEVEATE